MLHDYDDIRSRIAQRPIWWDEHGVPRYRSFRPNDLADIYAEEAALVLITCQGCGHEFRVAFSFGPSEKISSIERLLLIEIEKRLPQTKEELEAMRKEVLNRAWKRTLADSIREKCLHYGDPPNIGCCPAGPTMNSEPRQVLQYWRRFETDENGNIRSLEWHRDRSLEIDITPEWATGE
jgi:hypothetical protein